jgi:hypothetical protein
MSRIALRDAGEVIPKAHQVFTVSDLSGILPAAILPDRFETIVFRRPAAVVGCVADGWAMRAGGVPTTEARRSQRKTQRFS